MNQMIRYSYAIALIVLCAAYRSDAQSDVTLVDKDISVYGFNMRYGEAGQGEEARPACLCHRIRHPIGLVGIIMSKRYGE